MEILIVNNETSDVPLPATYNSHLYKHYPNFSASEHAQENLTNLIVERKIRTTSAEFVNDPMDCNPAYISNMNVNVFRNYYRYVRDITPQSSEQFELKNIIMRRYPDEKSILKIRRVPKMWAQTFEKTIMKAFNSFGFVCYTENPRNPLMWAHYSSSHYGLCVEFPTHPSFETNVLSDVPLCSFSVNMNYSDDRPRILASENIPTTNPEALQEAILTKSKHWSYEREWRVLGKYKIDPLFEPCTLIDIGEGEPISSIIFGLKSTSEFRKQISELVDKSKLNIQLKECYLSKKNYEIRIRKIS